MSVFLRYKKKIMEVISELLKLKAINFNKSCMSSLIIRPSLLNNQQTFVGFEKVFQKQYGNELGSWLAKFLTKFHSDSKVGNYNYFVSSFRKEVEEEMDCCELHEYQFDTYHRIGEFGGPFIKDSKDCLLPSDRENCAIIRFNGKKIEFDSFHDYFQMLAIFGVSRKDGFFPNNNEVYSWCAMDFFLTKNPKLSLWFLANEGYYTMLTEDDLCTGFLEIDFQKSITLDENLYEGYIKTYKDMTFTDGPVIRFIDESFLSLPLNPEIILKDFDNFLLATDLTFNLVETEDLEVFIKILENIKVSVMLEIAGISNNKKTYFNTNIENKIPLRKLLRYLNNFLNIAKKDFVKKKSFFEKIGENFFTMKRFFRLSKSKTNNFAFLKTKKVFILGSIIIFIILLFLVLKLIFKTFFILLFTILFLYRIKTWKKKRSFLFWKDFYLDFKMNFFFRIKNAKVLYLILKLRTAIFYLIFGLNVEIAITTCNFTFASGGIIVTLAKVVEEENLKRNLNITTILANLAKIYKNAPIYLGESILIMRKLSPQTAQQFFWWHEYLNKENYVGIYLGCEKDPDNSNKPLVSSTAYDRIFKKTPIFLNPTQLKLSSWKDRTTLTMPGECKTSDGKQIFANSEHSEEIFPYLMNYFDNTLLNYKSKNLLIPSENLKERIVISGDLIIDRYILDFKECKKDLLLNMANKNNIFKYGK